MQLTVNSDDFPMGIDAEKYNAATAEKEKILEYQYDSLVYRYIRAREKQAEYEFMIDTDLKHNKQYYYDIAQRDILKFIQILDDTIGEHK